MKDRAVVEEKLRRMIAGGKEKLQIITDFDRTLSKYHHNGELTKSSYCVFESVPSLPTNFVEGAQALYKRFRVIEDNPNMTTEEKLPHMKEWWNLNEKLFIDVKYEEHEMESAVVNSNVHLRVGTEDAFRKLSASGVPVLVFSAGVGDVVKAIMRHYAIDHPNVHVISNFFKWENGFITGFQGTLIHIYNKNQHAIENSDYFQELSHRENVILMGDSLGDSNMAEGVPGNGTVLKIGFLCGTIDEYLPQYLESFDIVLCDDQTMNVFNSILKLIL
ncbi:hypothetical protein AAG570_005809 [Ranatra chinensis]|uniref:5'-nucleotidase n=1 Tax=Ranatra chinensis TaxID=642074 RepID=A0ABD0YGW0_9HEMI